MKIFASLIIVVTLICCLFPGYSNAMPATYQPAQHIHQQILLSRKCCDGYGTVRCILGNWTPVGNDCFCYGQGWGTTC